MKPQNNEAYTFFHYHMQHKHNFRVVRLEIVPEHFLLDGTRRVPDGHE